MSDIQDVAGEGPAGLAGRGSKKTETPHTTARARPRRTALTAGAGALAGLTLGQPVSAFAATAKLAGTPGSIFGTLPALHFTLVHHVTPNPLFTPTQHDA